MGLASDAWLVRQVSEGCHTGLPQGLGGPRTPAERVTYKYKNSGAASGLYRVARQPGHRVSPEMMVVQVQAWPGYQVQAGVTLDR